MNRGKIHLHARMGDGKKGNKSKELLEVDIKGGEGERNNL